MILLGGLLVFALVGFWMMGRVDRFLNAARAEQEGRQHAECLKIAASDPCVMQPVFKTVSALKEQHPDLWCELSFGRSLLSVRELRPWGMRFWDVSAQAMWTLRFSPVRQGAERRLKAETFCFRRFLSGRWRIARPCHLSTQACDGKGYC